MNQGLEEKYQAASSYTRRKPRILVAPLDWGLGHATRCIPLIQELLRQNCEILLAAEAAQAELLKTEFPSLEMLSLNGYRVKYSRSALGLLWSIFRQSARILAEIRKENAWLKRIVKERQIDAVISDNRYGLYHAGIPCIFMTHQLLIKSRLGPWSEKLLQKKNYRHIQRFSECWIPDADGQENLAGELSHPAKLPSIPVRYLGIISRFERVDDPGKKDHLLILLSGPEPQRTILENIMEREISHYPGTATIVRGLPAFPSFIPSTEMLQFYNHLPLDALKKEIASAGYVITRSGYSTVMDIIKMGKKAIFIPTPGQPEQEYLGKYLAEKQLAFSVEQKKFSLPDALSKAMKFNYNTSFNVHTKLNEVVSEFVSRLEKY